MIQTQNYYRFITDLLRQHMVALGPEICLDIARNVSGLEVDQSGSVTKLTGQPILIIQELINSLTQLCQPFSFLILSQTLKNYPMIASEYNTPIPRVRLTCVLTKRE